MINSQKFIWKAFTSFNLNRGISRNIAIAFVACDPESVVNTINSHNSTNVARPKAEQAPREREVRPHIDKSEPARVIYSYKNPFAMVPLLAFVAICVVWAPDAFRDANLKEGIRSAIIYLICVPSLLYAIFSYKKADGEIILTKLFGIEISRYHIRDTVRIYKHGYDHMKDYGLHDYINGDMFFGTWTIEGKDGDRVPICNIGRFNTNVLPILEYVVNRCPNKIDLDGDAWAKIKGINL